MFAQVGNAQQQDSFDSLWKQVKNLEAENLTKSALKLVDTIAEKAKTENNGVQIIKALLYKSKFTLILEEDAQLEIVNDFKTEITNSQGATKNILHSS